ncbi:hypothetical protein HU200_035193 [Digitaria exilis]|uniref:Non-haem dioxygenase N-terminal domain-containing protein n=1 Tax=Digitaria exilis TaxID=1010633 RepID=A0A835BNQ6_9POAL|nr:hypothetical protein HU200_035193 [Digitaria exilis]
MARSVGLPVVDLVSPDLRAAAAAVRQVTPPDPLPVSSSFPTGLSAFAGGSHERFWSVQACVEHGFFYVTNHGVDNTLMESLFAESKAFFDLPMEEKMKLQRSSNHRGYTPPYAEKLDASSKFVGWKIIASSASPLCTWCGNFCLNTEILTAVVQHGTWPVGDLKESFYIGPIGDSDLNDLNQWPSEERFPSWKETMTLYIAAVLDTGKRILSLIALGLDLDAEFFEKIGEVNKSDSGNYGASAHSDYGAITLLVTDGTPGLQIIPCRSTLHRVVAVGKERYSIWDMAGVLVRDARPATMLLKQFPSRLLQSP